MSLKELKAVYCYNDTKNISIIYCRNIGLDMLMPDPEVTHAVATGICIDGSLKLVTL